MADIRRYMEEIKDSLSKGDKAAAFDRIADLDNAWIPDRTIPAYMTYQEWCGVKKELQSLMRKL